MKSVEYGIVLGRFQPIHVGHIEYLEQAKKNCDRLIVGITNPDISAAGFHAADPNRYKKESNPFPYFLRYEMIQAALCGLGWKQSDFGVVPADLESVATLRDFFPPPTCSKIFVTVYDAWGDEKARRLQELGYEVEVLWRRTMSQRVTSGTELRQMMSKGRKWQHLIPNGAVELLERFGSPLLAPAAVSSSSQVN